MHRTQRLLGRLGHAQIASYRSKGFLGLDSVQLSSESLQRARQGLEDLLAHNSQVLPEQLVSAHLSADVKGSTVKGVPAFLDLVKDDAIVDLAASVLDTDDLLCWGCQVFCKLPGEGRSVPFHQDGQYWPIEPLETVTTWVALDDSDTQNGGVWFVPGSHTLGYLPHVQKENPEMAISYVLDDEVLKNLAAPEPMELKAGGVSLHNPAIVHGSEVNRSQRRRAGVAIHYMPSHCWFRRDLQTLGEKLGGIKLDYADRPLVLVRGRNNNPRNEHVVEL